MSQQHKQTIQNSINWFLNSGIMSPSDGSWGIAERIIKLEGNEAREKICNVFPARTPLEEGWAVLEHRRPDCICETALLFDLAADYFDNSEYRKIADNLISYLLEKSSLQQLDTLQDEERVKDLTGLWGWANPNFRPFHWIDDNAWVVILLLKLAQNNRPHLIEPAMTTARGLYLHVKRFMDHVEKYGKDETFDELPVIGLRFNPHWIGLALTSLTIAAEHDKNLDCSRENELYFEKVMEGPAAYDTRSIKCAVNYPWCISEYAYLALDGSMILVKTENQSVRKSTWQAFEYLLEYQQEDGHIAAEHYETPAAPHLSDLIYTQNWSTLALYCGTQVFKDKPELQEALTKSLTFLSKIQDTSPSPTTRGCWRGLYDTKAKDWGGGDRHEGGAGSIYSGWTNAPIAWTLLLNEMDVGLV
ncbi:MAG: hypothetical protein ACYTFY_19400 [Planctomycetota bacterium]|jgi:hypothetical protein